MTDHQETPEELGLLTITTWIYELHGLGVEPADDGLVAAMKAIDEAGDAEAGDAAGWALVEAVGAILDSLEPEGVAALAGQLYGDRVRGDLGAGGRGERTTRIRKYQFSRRLPWLARIVERHADGRVAPSWLLIQACTDRVVAMDPNPWNGIDETRFLPLIDFQVLWELDGCTAVAVA